MGDAQGIEHARGIGGIAVGEHQAAARQAHQPFFQARRAGQGGHVDIVNIAQEFIRIDAVEVHQPGQRGAVIVEIHLLHAPRLGMVAAQQIGDVGPIRTSIWSNRQVSAG
jgi:hypothetical protein